MADHGADGTAANDDTALANGLAYAAAHPYTVVRFPKGTWALSVSSAQPGFAIPSNTVLEGAANNSTILTWNDVSNGGYSLLTDTAPAGGGRNANVVLRNLVVQGTWGPCSGCSWTPGGNNAIFLFLIDDVTIDHVTSRYSGAFGMTVRASTNVKLLDDSVYYAASDGMNNDDDSGIFARNFNVQHDADDCFSAHSDIYDQGGVRRNIQITGGYCFDTLAIDVASPVSMSITGTTIDSFRKAAIIIGASPPYVPGPGTNPDTEGNSQGQDVTIDNVVMTNGITTQNTNNPNDPANFDKNDRHVSGLEYISIEGISPRAGSLAVTPGENLTTPYPYAFNNSYTASVPIAAFRTISIHHSVFGRHFGASNYTGLSGDTSSGNTNPEPAGVQTAIKNWAGFGQGGITMIDGIYTPSLTELDLIGPGVSFNGNSTIRNLDVSDDTFEGLSTPIYFLPGNTSHVADFAFDRNRMVDMRANCLDVEWSGKLDGEANDNYCDADPYGASGNRRSTGSWNNEFALIGFYFGFNPAPAPHGLVAKRNTFKNVSIPTEINTSNPATGVLWSDNVEFANPVTIDSFNQNNGGIGHVISAGFSSIAQMDTNPNAPGPNNTTIPNPNYESVYNVPVDAAPSMPTTGFWTPGEYVRNSAWSPSNPALGWQRLTLSQGNGQSILTPTNYATNIDWAPTYLHGYTPPAVSLVQTASARNADSSTTASVSFANAPAAADTVILTLINGAGSSGTFAPTTPTGCTELAGLGMGGYSVATFQNYEVWTCTPATTYSVGGLVDGGLIQAADVANYDGADVIAGPLNSSSTMLTVPVTGSTTDLRFGLVEWNNPATTATVAPSSIATTGYYSGGSDGYHFGLAYVLPGSVAPGSFTATTKTAVTLATYVQIDLAQP